MSLDTIQNAAREQFQKQSHRYAKGHILEETGDVVAALALTAVQPGAEALDVATGAGHTAFCLARAGLRVTASDLAPAMLQRVAEGAAERGLRVAVRQHQAEELPYPDGTFDLVTCRVAPHHFSSPASFVRESARVLKPGGWLIVIDGTVPDDSAEAGHWLHQVEKLRDPSHNRLLPPREWRALAQAAGLEVVAVAIDHRKQPDLEWYFETAATTPESRARVRELVAGAPDAARSHYRIAEEEGRIIWWWPMLTMVARKPAIS